MIATNTYGTMASRANKKTPTNPPSIYRTQYVVYERIGYTAKRIATYDNHADALHLLGIMVDARVHAWIDIIK